ncbi:MAG: hypothetical protein ACUVXD_03040 [Thermodesulfobacteriota bacterium]
MASRLQKRHHLAISYLNELPVWRHELGAMEAEEICEALFTGFPGPDDYRNVHGLGKPGCG